MNNKKNIQYMCTYCGKKETRSKTSERLMPGKCPRRNGNMPHSWVKNREL